MGRLWGSAMPHPNPDGYVAKHRMLTQLVGQNAPNRRCNSSVPSSQWRAGQMARLSFCSAVSLSTFEQSQPGMNNLGLQARSATLQSV